MRHTHPANNAPSLASPPEAPAPTSFRALPAAAGTVAAGLLNVYLACTQISRFAGIFRTRLPNQPLPLVTAVLLGGHWVFIALALLWPAIAIAALWSRRPQFSIVTIAGLITLQVAYTVLALYMPLFRVLHQTGGAR